MVRRVLEKSLAVIGTDGDESSRLSIGRAHVETFQSLDCGSYSDREEKERLIIK